MKLNHIDVGRGPAVLLVHAFPLNHAMWAPQVANLKDRFRVVAPDLRGFGNSPVSNSWNLNDAAADLAELLDFLQIEDCALIGLSMGGYIALPFYARYPERVRQLVLADTRARADTDNEKAARTNMISDLGEFGTAILPERMLARLLKPNAPLDVLREVTGIMSTTTAPAAIFALMAMRDRPDASTILHKITCPTLVLAGEHDVVTRVDECREMAETVPDGNFVKIRDAGHLSNLENAAAFNAALQHFLK